MNILLEALFALFAAFGVLCLGWTFFGWLLQSRQKGRPVRAYAVIPACAAGDGLEHVVRSLSRMKDMVGCPITIVIADEGLDETGRAVAALLQKDDPSLAVCRANALGTLIVPQERKGE